MSRSKHIESQRMEYFIEDRLKEIPDLIIEFRLVLTVWGSISLHMTYKEKNSEPISLSMYFPRKDFTKITMGTRYSSNITKRYALALEQMGMVARKIISAVEEREEKRHGKQNIS